MIVGEGHHIEAGLLQCLAYLIGRRTEYISLILFRLAVYPAAKLDVDEGGVSRWTSPPPVASRSVAVPVLPNPMSYPQVAVD